MFPVNLFRFGQHGDEGEDEDDMLPHRQHGLHPPPEPDERESPRFRPGKGNLIWPCPSCESLRTEQRHIARRICSAVGAETGTAIGLLGGPGGAVCGGIAGAILAGLVAGAAGCATGAALGEAIDQTVLNNWRCLACGRVFTVCSR
jgi:hypothetical protein